MHISFSKYGKGSALAAAKYLTQTHDSHGVARAGVQVLRGDPYIVADVADSLNFVNRYTLGVISFAPEDQPTQNQLEDILDEFEKTAWAGLEFDRYSWSAVLHRDVGGGCHIHILTARVDLASWRSLNIAPPGWIGTYKHLRNWQNAKHGWARPDDPSRAKLIRKPKHELVIDAGNLRQGLIIEENPRQLITDYLVAQIELGTVKDRSSVISALHRAGLETPRQGKYYITVKNPDNCKKWRLKGSLYDKSWQVGQAIEIANRAGHRENKCPDPTRAKQALQKLEEKRRNRAIYHQHRYGSQIKVFGPEPKPELESTLESIQQDLERYRTQTLTYLKKTQTSSPRTKMELVETNSSGLNVHPINRRRKLGDTPVFKPVPIEREHRNSPTRTDTLSSSTARQVEQLRRATLRSDRLNSSQLPRWLQDLEFEMNKKDDDNDRTRTQIITQFGKIKHAISHGHGSIKRALSSGYSAFRNASHKLDTACFKLDQTIYQYSQCIERGLTKYKGKHVKKKIQYAKMRMH